MVFFLWIKVSFWHSECVECVCSEDLSKKSNLLRINAHYWAHSHSCNVSNTHVCAVRLPRSNSTRSHMSKSHSEPTEWLHSSSSVFDFFRVSFFSVFFSKRTPKNIRMCMHFRLSVTSKIRFQQKERKKKNRNGIQYDQICLLSFLFICNVLCMGFRYGNNIQRWWYNWCGVYFVTLCHACMITEAFVNKQQMSTNLPKVAMCIAQHAKQIDKTALYCRQRPNEFVCVCVLFFSFPSFPFNLVNWSAAWVPKLWKIIANISETKFQSHKYTFSSDWNL